MARIVEIEKEENATSGRFAVRLDPAHPAGQYRRAGWKFVAGQDIYFDSVPEAIQVDPWLMVAKVEGAAPPRYTSRDRQAKQAGRLKQGTMAYIVQADLTEVLSAVALTQLTDDEKTGAQVADRVTRAIASAESVVNGYLGTRYVVPVTGTIPDIMQKWAVDVAKYFLYQRRRVPEDVRQAYEDAIAMLRDVSSGKMTLGIEPAPTGSTVFSGGGAVYTEERIFTRDSLASY